MYINLDLELGQPPVQPPVALTSHGEMVVNNFGDIIGGFYRVTVEDQGHINQGHINRADYRRYAQTAQASTARAAALAANSWATHQHQVSAETILARRQGLTATRAFLDRIPIRGNKVTAYSLALLLLSLFGMIAPVAGKAGDIAEKVIVPFMCLFGTTTVVSLIGRDVLEAVVPKVCAAKAYLVGMVRHYRVYREFNRQEAIRQGIRVG